MAITIFSAERRDGLESAIAADRCLAYLSPLVMPSTAELQKVLMNPVAMAAFASAGHVDFDLHPIYSVLATTGWNKNDDIFDRQEAWIARATPQDKPFNQSHVPSKIIGHITGSVVVDDNMTLVPDTSTFDELPDKFHILTSAVVYKHINSIDKDLRAEAAELIEGIIRGDWFVSMECLFAAFDYGLTSASGEQQVVARNEKTAFLTKHLRIYNGVGEYNGCKLGRVLRHITFSGKGLVKTPANPESVIFNDAKQFVGVTLPGIILEEETLTNATAGDKRMTELEKIAALETQLAAANLQLKEVGVQQAQATIAAKDTEIAELKTAALATAKTVEELTASKASAITAKEAAEKIVAEVNTKLTEATAQLEVIKAEAQKTTRISTLVDKGVDKSVAEVLVAKFATASDETFAEVVTMQSELVAAKKAVPPMAAKKDDKDPKGEKAGDCAKADDATDPVGEKAATASIETAVVDADIALATSDEDKNAEVITALASYFDAALNGSEKK